MNHNISFIYSLISDFFVRHCETLCSSLTTQNNLTITKASYHLIIFSNWSFLEG